ncbi:lipoprotein-releasing ABC transporter permease subunit LolE [Utexia brackfieldae]
MTSLSFLVAWRFRKGRKRSGMLSLVSIISTLSIALGIIALLVGLSAMNGFERQLRERVLAVVPHAEVSSAFGLLNNWPQLASELQKNSQIVATAPYISFTGLIENGAKLGAVLVKGVDPVLEEKISALPHYVNNDGWHHFTQGASQIILGKGLAEQLNVKQGDWVTLLIPDFTQTDQLKPPKRVRVQIAGILELSGTLGYKFALISLKDAQNYHQTGDSVTGLSVGVKDILNAKQIMNNAVKNLSFPVKVSNWEDKYGYMYRDIQMIRSIMYLAMILVIGVSCFNIISTLIIAVKDKTADIAILKTLGADNRFIRRIFLWYGVISGFMGSIVGIIFGVLIALNLSSIVGVIESLIGHKFLNSHIYFIDFLPSELHITDVVIVFATAMILSLLASYYPASRAFKIEPAKVLSGV